MTNPFAQFHQPDPAEDEQQANPFAQFHEVPDLTGMTPEQQVSTAMEYVPSFLKLNAEEKAALPQTRAERYIAGRGRKTPEEIAADQSQKTSKLISGLTGYADGVTGGQYAEMEAANTAYPSYGRNAGMAARFLDEQGLLPNWAGGGRGDLAEQFEGGFEAMQAKRHADNPISTLGGNIVGYLTPGGAGWKAMSAGAKSIPGAAHLTRMIQSTGRVPSWLQRLGGSMALFTADAGLFGGTIGASHDEAFSGEDASMMDRLEKAREYAASNLGDVGDALGIEVPKYARKIPVSMALPFAGSIVERGIKGVTSGGKTITPDRASAEALENVGRLPRADSAAREMADVLVPAGEGINAGHIKTFQFLENALRDSAKQAGVAKESMSEVIMTGFDRIRQAMPELADGRTTVTQMIERGFADDLGPAVKETLRRFLLKVDLEDPGVIRPMINALRETQVEDFRQLIGDNLGARNPDGTPQTATEFEQTVQAGIKKKGQERQKVLDKAQKVANDSPIANSLREHLYDSEFKNLLQGEANTKGWKDVDTFIKEDPWNAASLLQSQLGRMEQNAFNAGNPVHYSNLRASKEWIQDMLGKTDDTGLPGYNRFTGQIASEARVRENLGYVDEFDNVVPGFGPDLKQAARTERGTQRMVDRYEGNTPLDQAAVQRLPDAKDVRDRHLERTQAAARASTGEVFTDQLRGARPGGTNQAGQDVFGLRLTDLQNVGMMDAIARVLGAPGEAVASGVNKLVNRRQFLADVDARTGSPTHNKQIATAQGDQAFSSGLGRSISADNLADVMLLTSGIPPIATLLRRAPEWIQKPFAPSRGDRAAIARALMQTPGGRTVAEIPDAIRQLTGHSNPKWDSNGRWKDDMLTGTDPDGRLPTPAQQRASEAGFVTPEVLLSPASMGVQGAGAGAMHGWVTAPEDASMMDKIAQTLKHGGIGAAGALGLRYGPPGVIRAKDRVMGAGNLPKGTRRSVNGDYDVYELPTQGGPVEFEVSRSGAQESAKSYFRNGVADNYAVERSVGESPVSAAAKTAREIPREVRDAVGNRRYDKQYETPIDDVAVVQWDFDPRGSGSQSARAIRDSFDQSFNALRDHVVRHRRPVYEFEGIGAGHTRLYRRELSKPDALPRGYSAFEHDNRFFLVRDGHEETLQYRLEADSQFDAVPPKKISRRKSDLVSQPAASSGVPAEAGFISSDVLGAPGRAIAQLLQNFQRMRAGPRDPRRVGEHLRGSVDDQVRKSFTVGSNKDVDVQMNLSQDGNSLRVDFEVNGSYRRGQDTPAAPIAERREILDQVGTEIQTYVDRYQPDRIHMSANSRGKARLYARMVEENPPPGYDVERTNSGVSLRRREDAPQRPLFDRLNNPRGVAEAVAQGTSDAAPGQLLPLDGFVGKSARSKTQGPAMASERRVAEYLANADADAATRANAAQRIESTAEAQSAVMGQYRSQLRSIAERHSDEMETRARLTQLIRTMPGMSRRGARQDVARMVDTHMGQIERGNVRAYSADRFTWRQPDPVPPPGANQDNAQILRQEQARAAGNPSRRQMHPEEADELTDLLFNPERSDDAYWNMAYGNRFDSFDRTGQIAALLGMGGGAYAIGNATQPSADRPDPAAIADAERERLLNSWIPGTATDTIEVQSALVRHGLVNVPKDQDAEQYLRNWIDGEWGPSTSNALRAFQRREGLPATGKMTPATAEALGIADEGEN